MSEDVFVVVLDPDADRGDKNEVLETARKLSPAVWHSFGSGWEALGVGDGTQRFPVEGLQRLPAVERIVPVGAAYHLASRDVFPHGTAIRVAARDPLAHELVIGGGSSIAVMAGPTGFDVSSAPGTARRAAAAGANIFYAGDYLRYVKDDPGRVADDLAALRAATDTAGLHLCIEIDDVKEIMAAIDVADVFVIDSRNMQNFALLREVGQTEPPIILKRGAGATAEEFILAAEYVLSGGNGRVVLCEPSFSVVDGWKPPFEVNLVSLVKSGTHLPVMADLSRLKDTPWVAERIAAAAIAAGADALLLAADTGAGTEDEQVAALSRVVSGARHIRDVLREDISGD